MSKSLVIVESPSKAKTIGKYVGKEYTVEASVGHIWNLPKSKLGVDIENGFEVSYETIAGKEEVIKKLRDHAKKAPTVFIATDPDREGEAIAAHIEEAVTDVAKDIKRVLFHEITESGVKHGMSHPRKLDKNLVQSQQARRAMDRIVGYKVSPFIWRTVAYGLSAGRVQSVALRLICEREQEVRAFVPEEYWSLTAEFKAQGADTFLAKLAKIDGNDFRIPDEENLHQVLEKVKNQNYQVSSVERKPVKRNPPNPFITSTLQQEAARRLGLSAKRTMMLAQKLYEGMELGPEGMVGLITYMRTDSTRVSSEAIQQVREYIYENYGKEYLPDKLRVGKKDKNAQDAHEAIRPTSMKYSPKEIKKYLDKDVARLYELIWQRFIASQMNPAEFEQLTIELEGGSYLFRASDQALVFRGFLQAYEEVEETNGDRVEEDPVSKLPTNLKEGQAAAITETFPRQHFTKPPARYSESMLVRDLEALGIGRPSTYALIVSTVVDRKYVEQNEKRLFATDLGMQVNQLLIQNFPNIVNVKFTAKMEKELDTIAAGETPYLKVMEDFYHPFKQSLDHATQQEKSIKKSLQVETDIVCDLCGKPMVEKWGRNGKFMACSGYPECRNTKPMAEEQSRLPQISGVVCELCGEPMVVKSGKYGTFLGCSTYPKCKNTKPITTGFKCPECEKGEILERKTKRRRIFYGCTNYPECNFASWDPPVAIPCPSCNWQFTLRKVSVSKGNTLKCPKCGEITLETAIQTEKITA